MQHVVRVFPPDGSGAGTDISCWVDEVTINHGRDDSGSQPDASSASVNFTTDPDVYPLPAVVEIGAILTVTTTTATTTSQRFTGRITDLSLGWDDAGADTPDAGIGQMVAVGILADLGRRVVGDAPWPQELDGARVSRVMTAAGITLDPAYSDPGTVQILARDVDSQPALDVARDAAESASGVVWETRAGEVRYADAVHRKGIRPALTVDACVILVTPSWRRTLEGLVNEVSIGYGVAAEGADQPRYTATNPTSQARYGRFGYTATTSLAALADAQALGQLLLVRNGSPVWVMAALPIDVPSLTPAQYDALLSLDMHALVTLTGLPAIGTAPTVANLWVEGWKETLTFGQHDIELVVSGYCRTVPAPRWDDVDPSWLWGGQALTERRRNRVWNPIGPTGTATGWWVLSRVTQALNGDAIRLTVNDATVAALAQRINSPFGVASWPKVTAGKTYTLSFDMRSNSAATGGCTFGWYDAAGAVVGSTAQAVPVVLNAANYTRVTLTAVAPAGAAFVYPGLGLWLGARNVGEWFDIRRVLLEEATTAGTFFDGDTADVPNAWDYAWAGAARNSDSVQSSIASTPGGVPPSMTWDDAACFGPPANLGRWDDVAATLRWDQVPATTTWDTWNDHL
jgi:hypothetical protein